MIDTVLRVLASRAFWLAVGGAAAVLLIYLFGHHWRPATQVRIHQAALLTAVRKSDTEKWAALISESYADPWGLTKKDAVTGFKELRRQFLVLDLQPEGDPAVAVEGETGRLSVKLHAYGTSVSPLGPMMLTAINELEQPFVFEWRKEGGAPWNWRLATISNQQLPDLRGYTPGDLDRMTEGF